MKSLSNLRKTNLIISLSIIANSNIAFNKGLLLSLLLYFAFEDNLRFKEVAIN